MLSKIRLELARTPDHPAGDSGIGYDFVAPLDGQGHINLEQWQKHKNRCRVRRFRPGEDDDVGHLIRKPGGAWAFHYDLKSDGEDDETGFRFAAHAFRRGEYISIRDDDELQTFRVVSVEGLP